MNREKIMDWALKLYWVSMGILVVMLFMQEPEPVPAPKVQAITMEDGTKCVVLKGIYSDNAITCNWRD